MSREKRLIQKLNKQENVLTQTPVATDIFLPNYGVVKGATNLFNSGSIIYAGENGGLAADSTYLFYDANNRRVGIGTTSPSTVLHILKSDVAYSPSWNSSTDNLIVEVNGDNYIQIHTPPTGTGGIQFSDTTRGVGSIFYDHNTNYMRFTTNGSERVRIDSSGNVGIGTTTPNSAALLDLASTTKGFKLMNMSTTQRDNISNPPAGLMIYNSTTNKLNFYNGSAWEVVTSA